MAFSTGGNAFDVKYGKPAIVMDVGVSDITSSGVPDVNVTGRFSSMCHLELLIKV